MGKKNFDFSDLRKELSSDATKENEELKESLESIKKKHDEEVSQLKEELNQYKDWTRQLSNRCFVLTKGLTCLECGCDACKYHFTEQEMNWAVNYMVKNRMPRTIETREKIFKLLSDMRAKRLNLSKWKEK